VPNPWRIMATLGFIVTDMVVYLRVKRCITYDAAKVNHCS
jgi:hypothetical protein